MTRMSPTSHNDGTDAKLDAVRAQLEHLVELSLRWRPLAKKVWKDAARTLADSVLG
jgi:hypothetical protein